MPIVKKENFSKKTNFFRFFLQNLLLLKFPIFEQSIYHEKTRYF